MAHDGWSEEVLTSKDTEETEKEVEVNELSNNFKCRYHRERVKKKRSNEWLWLDSQYRFPLPTLQKKVKWVSKEKYHREVLFLVKNGRGGVGGGSSSPKELARTGTFESRKFHGWLKRSTGCGSCSAAAAAAAAAAFSFTFSTTAFSTTTLSATAFSATTFSATGSATWLATWTAAAAATATSMSMTQSRTGERRFLFTSEELSGEVGGCLLLLLPGEKRYKRWTFLSGHLSGQQSHQYSCEKKRKQRKMTDSWQRDWTVT